MGKNNITPEQVKRLQLDVLMAVHEFCQEKGITYSLGCGSMLGCARHHGYIPWDDDIDIYLLRADYNRLVREFPNLYKERYMLHSLERDSSWNRAYAKASDSKTIFIESSERNKTLGINIDIYPIDQVPENMSEFSRYNKKRLFYQHLYELKVVSFRRNRNLYKNIILALSKCALLPFSTRFIAKFLSSYAQKYNHIKTTKVFECSQGLMQKRSFPKALFNETILMPFEDRMVMGFKDFDAYLSNAYGDWRKLPPIEKQVSHHAFKAYWR